MHNIKHMLFLGLALLVAVGTFQGCSGDKGPAGPEGKQGPKGEVGPAGDDGNVMLSGKGKPKDSNGNNGDYFLNTKTGGLFGPKEDGSWDSSPGIVLKGQDGKDGADGKTIRSGTGAPDQSVGNVGDFYLDTSSYKLYGPKTSGSGWGSGTGLKGADGNANVTRYIFPGNDFASNASYCKNFAVDSKSDYKESTDLVYLVRTLGTTTFRNYVPGPAYSGLYTVYTRFVDSSTEEELCAQLESGTGETMDNMEVVHIRATSTIDMTKRAPGAIIPEDLNTDNYQEVADYYGFGSK